MRASMLYMLERTMRPKGTSSRLPPFLSFDIDKINIENSIHDGNLIRSQI